MRVVLSFTVFIPFIPFIPFLWIIWLPQFRAQPTPPSSSPSRSLDALLQDYAYRAFVRPRTGVPYDGVVPSNLTGIQISALRLRSGSLRTRGVPNYKEFEIPMGIVESPYVERLVFVYQNLANWSTRYYPLSGFTHLTPVVGLLAYDAFNLSAKNLPELEIQAPLDKPILIKFPQVQSVPDGSIAQCVRFGLDGLAELSNVTSGNICSTTRQGHFSIVAEVIAPAPAPLSPPPTSEGPPGKPPGGGGGGRGGGGDNDKDDNSRTWIIVGSVVGGFVLLVLLGLLAFWVQRYKRRNKMQQMEKAAEVGEALHMASVGNSRAPVAMGTRTQPTLENEYVP